MKIENKTNSKSVDYVILGVAIVVLIWICWLKELIESKWVAFTNLEGYLTMTARQGEWYIVVISISMLWVIKMLWTLLPIILAALCFFIYDSRKESGWGRVIIMVRNFGPIIAMPFTILFSGLILFILNALIRISFFTILLLGTLSFLLLLMGSIFWGIGDMLIKAAGKVHKFFRK